jgi:hypothetical protein
MAYEKATGAPDWTFVNTTQYPFPWPLTEPISFEPNGYPNLQDCLKVLIVPAPECVPLPVHRRIYVVLLQMVYFQLFILQACICHRCVYVLLLVMLVLELIWIASGAVLPLLSHLRRLSGLPKPLRERKWYPFLSFFLLSCDGICMYEF